MGKINKLDCFAFARNDVNALNVSTSYRLNVFKKVAFTLAEVLITLGIIGVVAALTMPTLVANVTERVNSSREANIAQKITKATDQMKALGLMDGSYNTTDEFVDELQKYLKIAKRCSADNIDACWPTKIVKTADGEEFEVKNAKTGKNLNLKNNTSNNVGLVLADGASIILTYNQASQGIDESDAIVANKKSLPVGGGKSEEFAYTSSTTAAIDFVMDVNGGKGPNSETINNKFNDIRSFKAARFSKGCAGVKIDGIGCVIDLGSSYEPMDCGQNNCNAMLGGCLAPRCVNPDSHDYSIANDYYSGAHLACWSIDPSSVVAADESTLRKIIDLKSSNPDLSSLSGTYWSWGIESGAYANAINLDDGSVNLFHFSQPVKTLCIQN